MSLKNLLFVFEHSGFLSSGLFVDTDFSDAFQQFAGLSLPQSHKLVFYKSNLKSLGLFLLLLLLPPYAFLLLQSYRVKLTFSCYYRTISYFYSFPHMRSRTQYLEQKYKNLIYASCKVNKHHRSSMGSVHSGREQAFLQTTHNDPQKCLSRCYLSQLKFGTRPDVTSIFKARKTVRKTSAFFFFFLGLMETMFRNIVKLKLHHLLQKGKNNQPNFILETRNFSKIKFYKCTYGEGMN